MSMASPGPSSPGPSSPGPSSPGASQPRYVQLGDDEDMEEVTRPAYKGEFERLYSQSLEVIYKVCEGVRAGVSRHVYVRVPVLLALWPGRCQAEWFHARLPWAQEAT